MRRFIWAAAALALAAPAQAQSRNPLDALRLEELAATRDRPLFRATRRPLDVTPLALPAAQAPISQTPVAVAAPPPYELIGVAIGGGAKIALVRNKATNEVLRLRPGEDAQGWRVTDIDRRQLKLTREGRTEALALTTTAGTETAGQPAPAQPPESVAAATARVPHVFRPDD